MNNYNRRESDMSDEVTQKIECSNCGKTLPSEWISSTESAKNCPDCGSDQKQITIGITDHLNFSPKESLSGKVKDSRYNSKQNPRHEFFEGDDLRHSDGRWMKKTRVIDKYNDKYIEKVVDPETGEIVHHCEEPLSAHYGHGTAKFKKGNASDE